MAGVAAGCIINDKGAQGDVMTDDLIKSLRDQSTRRLSATRTSLEGKLKLVDDKRRNPKVCIYVTGSLARLEANPSSDLDAFFFLSGCSEKNALSRIRDVKILNAVVESAEQNSFPDFSNDGEYLKFLHIDDVVSHIGGRADDYHNALTARMLLMLESQHLYNEVLFNSFRRKVVERYFVDFHKHNDEFKPIFLLNDILRFWRTMCLNYEHGREWRIKDKEKQAKGHLANLKLRFSRLNICYSFIAKMLVYGQNITIDQVIDVASTTPLERLKILGKRNALSRKCVESLLREYSWFLEAVGRPKQDVLEWISDPSNRKDAFDHSAQFISNMHVLVSHIAEEHKYMRYLVI